MQKRCGNNGSARNEVRDLASQGGTAVFGTPLKLAAIHREAVQEGSRSVSGAQPPVRVRICDCTLKRVPESRFLSSLQDESSSCSVTGGAPVGDRRLLSDILPGLIALSSAGDTHAHDFALNRNNGIIRIRHEGCHCSTRPSRPSTAEPQKPLAFMSVH